MTNKVQKKQLPAFLALTIICLIAALALLTPAVFKIFDRGFKRLDRMNCVVQENIHGIRVVKSLLQLPEVNTLQGIFPNIRPQVHRHFRLIPQLQIGETGKRFVQSIQIRCLASAGEGDAVVVAVSYRGQHRIQALTGCFIKNMTDRNLLKQCLRIQSFRGFLKNSILKAVLRALVWE